MYFPKVRKANWRNYEKQAKAGLEKLKNRNSTLITRTQPLLRENVLFLQLYAFDRNVSINNSRLL